MTSFRDVIEDTIMNTSSLPMMESYNSNAVTMATITSLPEELLPVPVPDWSLARPLWSGCWPAHVYGFGSAFLLAAALSVGSTPYCFRCRRSPRLTAATSTVNCIVGVVCLAQSGVLLVDAYHSTGRLPVALVQLVHGLVFPGVVSTLTILDRIFSALVKPRQQHLGSIKHPRLIATALSVYLLSTSATYLVISARPQTRLWLLLCQIVSLTWGCAAVFLVACQCVRLARYSRLTARSRRQTAMYVRAKRHIEQCLDESRDSQRRYELLKHLARLRVARTKADEFAQHQQQRMSGLDERGLSDVDLQTSTTDSSDQLHSDVEVTKTTTVKLSHNHFQYRRRSRRRRHVTGRGSASYGGSEAVRDFTVTALAAARLLWSPSPDSDGCYEESPSWHVCLHTADRCDSRRRNDATTCDRKRHDHRTSVTGTDSVDDIDDDAEETDSSSESRQHNKSTNSTVNEQPVLENLQNNPEARSGGECIADEKNVSRYCQQLEPASFGVANDDGQRQMSSVDASSRTYLLLDSTDAARPLSRRLTSAPTRLLRHAAAQWRKSRNVTSRTVGDVESSQRIACVAESYVLDATRVTTRHDADGGTASSSTLSAGRRSRPRRSHDVVLFENLAYDGRDDVTEAASNAEPGTSAQSTGAELDDSRQVSAGYLADTELDNVDWKCDPDTTATSSLTLPASSVYLGLNRLRSGRTVRLVWRTASGVVTSACVVCCLHIYSMLGVFGVLSNDRPASAWPWLGFQTLYRLTAFLVFVLGKLHLSCSFKFR